MRGLVLFSFLFSVCLTAFLSYADEDPNSIFKEDKEINRINQVTAGKFPFSCEVPPCVHEGDVPPICKPFVKDYNETAIDSCLKQNCGGTNCVYKACKHYSSCGGDFSKTSSKAGDDLREAKEAAHDEEHKSRVRSNHKSKKED